MIDKIKNLIDPAGEISLAHWQTVVFANISTVIWAFILTVILLTLRNPFGKDGTRIKTSHISTTVLLTVLVCWPLLWLAPTELGVKMFYVPFPETLIASILAVVFVQFFLGRKMNLSLGNVEYDSLNLKLMSIEISLGLLICADLAAAVAKLISYKLGLYTILLFPCLWFGLMYCTFALGNLCNIKLIRARPRCTAAIIRRLIRGNNHSTVKGSNHDPVASTELINILLREHQNSAEGWKYKDLVSEFYTWAERFNSEFELNIPIPVIAIARLKERNLAEFRLGRNSLGIRHEMTITQRHAESAESWRKYGSVLHECLHLWQGLYGQAGRGVYHNKEFRVKAASLGLIVSQKGCTQYASENSPFFNILAKYGVEVPSWCQIEESQATDEIRRTDALKLKIRANRYATRIKVAATQLRTICLTCGASLIKRVSRANNQV